MLSYPIDEAESLLDSKLKAAKLSLSNCEEDLDFLREQITVRRRLAFLGLGTEALLTTPSADRPWRWRSHESTTGMWCTSGKRRRKRRRAKERARLVPRRAESRTRGANAPKLVLDIIQSGLTIKTHPTPLSQRVKAAEFFMCQVGRLFLDGTSTCVIGGGHVTHAQVPIYGSGIGQTTSSSSRNCNTPCMRPHERRGLHRMAHV